MSSPTFSAQELQSGMRWEALRRDYFESRSMWRQAQAATSLGERYFYQLQERANG